MDPSQFNAGFCAMHTTTTQNTSLSNSLLNTPFVPAGAATDPQDPLVPGLKLPAANVHPCTWPGCPRFFACQHNVQQHIREKHTGERPFKCDICAAAGLSTAFARPYGLTRHKAQVHADGKRSKRAGKQPVENDGPNAGDFGMDFGDDVFQWDGEQMAGVEQTIVGAGDEFAELGATLAAANAEMDEMFNSHQSGNAPETQHQGFAFTCADCDFASADNQDVLAHLHFTHFVPSSRLCPCSTCSLVSFNSDQDAFNHAVLLMQGGFQVGKDTAGLAGQGPASMEFGTQNGAMPATSSDVPGNVNWDSFTIDPALL